MFEQRQQGQVIVSLGILDGDLVKPQGVNLGRQQVVVCLRGLEVLVSVQLVRVATAQVDSLQSQLWLNSTVAEYSRQKLNNLRGIGDKVFIKVSNPPR